MLQPPYIIFVVYVDPRVPGAEALIEAALHSLPPIPSLPVQLEVAHAWAIEVSASQAVGVHNGIAQYLANFESAHGGAVHWFTQICRSAELWQN